MPLPLRGRELPHRGTPLERRRRCADRRRNGLDPHFCAGARGVDHLPVAAVVADVGDVDAGSATGDQRLPAAARNDGLR